MVVTLKKKNTVRNHIIRGPVRTVFVKGFENKIYPVRTHAVSTDFALIIHFPAQSRKSECQVFADVQEACKYMKRLIDISEGGKGGYMQKTPHPMFEFGTVI